MRVVVDGLPLLGTASIATYLRDLLLHLSIEGKQHDYSILFRGFRKDTRGKIVQLKADPAFDRFRVVTVRLPNRFLEWSWTHRSVHIPFTEARLGHPNLFLATVHMTPVLRRSAVVLMAYDLIPLRFPQFYGGDQPLLQTRILRGIERADAIIAISQRTKHDYVEMLGAAPERITVVYPGIGSQFGAAIDKKRLDAVMSGYRLRRPYLLYVGVLAPHKNLGTLVRVFRRLKQCHRVPHQLVLCGRSQWGHDVLESAKDLILAGDCVILDFIPVTDLPFIYHGAEAFAFLSLYEGFGLPPLEAMACGVPVVSSNAGSLPEVVGDAGSLVSPTDEEAIEHALSKVLTDSDLRRELRRRGFVQAAKFSWSETARQTLQVFNRVCSVS